MKKKSKILVTGATGKTGAFVVEQLIERGYSVRAMARSHDERSQRLKDLGAEVVLGDFLDLASIRNAVKDINKVYFCYPPQGDRLVEATTIIAVAAKDEGVEAVVNMSQITARQDAPSALTRHHWLSENILDWADIGAVHIRPGYFTENLYLFNSQSIAEEGKIYLPYGKERHAPVAAEDIARVIVGILVDPVPHVGQRYVITGDRNMTIAEIAEVFTKVLGRPVEYIDLPIEVWGQILTEKAGLPEFLVSHLKAVAQDHKDGIFSAQTDVVERIGGQTPQSLEEFIENHRSIFTSRSELAAV